MVATNINEDLQVIGEVLKGQKHRYEVLIRKYNQKLYRVAKGILWDDNEIEDAMQEAYIKAYQQLPKFEGRAAFGTWLTRILINECLMKKRNKENNSVMELNETTGMQPADHQTPEKMVMNDELKGILEQAIAALPEKYRLVFIMREVENLSVSETTDALDITETNVKARLSRAKEMLRNHLLTEFPVNHLFDFNLTRCDRIVQNVFSRI